ncbi:MAG: NAD(P)H-dependent oxidoreductase subunit E, partial [Proteobacteria bacterium]|nr:NAD(P)H-dependent oxidoreductase subunit E [Pseudomonadota bacterium]
MPDATVHRYRHPGSSKRTARVTNRGRQVDDTARAEVRALLGDRPRDRDLLIEHLHLIQDRYRHISAAHLAALAEEMRIPMAEAYEVATFYAHFDVVKEGETPPPPLTVRVCDSLTCEMMGAAGLLAALPERLRDGIRVVRAPCMGRCDRAPVAEVGHRHVVDADVDAIAAAVDSDAHGPEIPPYVDFNQYVEDGGYSLLRDCLDGKRGADELIGIMQAAGLRGFGGAGFPAGQKWRYVRNEP